MNIQNESILKSLQSIGLSKKEASVYYSTLELGRGTVAEISRKAGINRTTGYSVLDSLINRGFVRISGKEPKQEYIAESPETILTSLNSQMQGIQINIENTKKLIPELKSIYRTEDRPQVRFYEGIEGLKQVYEDTLTTTSGELRAFAAYEDMHHTLKDYFPTYYKRRAEKGIRGRGIVPKTLMSLERMKHNKEEDRELACVPTDKFNISPEIDIYDNKVMIASWREKLGIIIESKEIADAMKQVFELAWAEAQRLDAESGSDAD
jgi:sugar-specific transcriptional regulator TrmB